MAESKTKATAKKTDEAVEAVDAISEDEDGRFAYTCPLNVFGKPLSSSGAAPCGFVSKGWPDEDSARLRGDEHETKGHQDGEATSELVDFINDNMIEV